MRRTRVRLALAIATVTAVGVGSVAVATGGGGFRETLTSYEEVPALSTPGVGEFRAFVRGSEDEISYRLTFAGLESDVRQAHIHFENRTNNGPIVVWLCDSQENPSPHATTPACPAGGGTVTGVITPPEVGTVSSAGQMNGSDVRGIQVGEFDELVRAMRAGATYVNVHSVTRPGGEIRAQIGNGRGGHHGH